MNSRERVQAILRHQPADRMPLTLDVGGGDGISGPYLKLFQQKTASASPADYFDYDIRTVPVSLIPQATDFTSYHPHIPDGSVFDEFGVGRLASDTFPLGLILSPWERFTEIQQVIDYPFPTFELNPLTLAEIERQHTRGYAVSVAAGSINEWGYYLRSMPELMVDLAERPAMAEVILEKVTELSTQVGTRLADAGADIICFYGDTGGQGSLLMSPKMWRRWIKPRWLRIFTAVHQANPQALVFFHSCGYIEPIIPDLIEIGLDILNPVQPEVMDPIQIKQKYGNQLSLWGGIGLQTTMKQPVEQVHQAVRDLMDAWTPGGDRKSVV